MFQSNLTESQGGKEVFKGIKRIQATNYVKFTKSSTYSKITRHEKKQENTTHNEEKNQSIETGPEIIQMVELVEQDIKTEIVNIINAHHMFQKTEENLCMIGRKIKDTNRISTNKNAVSEMKSTLDEINRKLDTVEEK